MQTKINSFLISFNWLAYQTKIENLELTLKLKSKIKKNLQPRLEKEKKNQGGTSSFESTSTLDRSRNQSIQQKWELKLKSNRNWNLNEINLKLKIYSAVCRLCHRAVNFDFDLRLEKEKKKKNRPRRWGRRLGLPYSIENDGDVGKRFLFWPQLQSESSNRAMRKSGRRTIQGFKRGASILIEKKRKSSWSSRKASRQE